MITARKEKEHFTYEDYLSWGEEERWELFDGEAIAMSPAPSTKHQIVSANLEEKLRSFLKDKPCVMLHAPLDVRLPKYPEEPDSDIDTVVQPDILVVCNKTKIDDKGVRGAPDLVIEILSPSTSDRDFRIKHDLYEKHGVKEYWIVDPGRAVHVYHLGEDGKYSPADLTEKDGIAESKLFKGFSIDLKSLFSYF